MKIEGAILNANNWNWKLAVDCICSSACFRAEKLPELGKAIGESLKEFKSATKGLADDDEENKKNEYE